MEKLKVDFTKDIITNDNILISQLKEELHLQKNKKNKNYYCSEIADFYYQKKYNKNIVEILSQFYDVPKCPITNKPVSYKLSGSIIFGKFSSSCSASEINNYISQHSESFKEHVERMKIDRKGEGNPMYGVKTWNSGLTKETDVRIKKISDDMMGSTFTEEVLQKMSDSAKKRKIHGHTGFKHSEESKQIMREKNIARFKKGAFPQTNSVPHKLVKNILSEYYGEVHIDFEEEFEYGQYVFDFNVGNNLIEVQGDYFHCNPKTRHAIPKSEMQKNNLERDKRKRKFVEQEKIYNLIEIWEYDIINNIEEVKKWLKNLKK